MTKADIVSKVSDKLGIDKIDVQATVEKFMEEVKTTFLTLNLCAAFNALNVPSIAG